MARILIVEDSEEGRYLLKTLLQGSGYEVIVTANGAEALQLARVDPPDIVVSDIMMPIMDGFQLCREWKQDEGLRNIPFIFYTAAYTSPQDQEFALSLGADRFIAKPTAPGIFGEMLHKIIREHEAGTFAKPKEPTVREDPAYLQEYSERLVKKLEEKVAELEKANQELAVLHAIAATASRSLELDTILQDVLKHVLETMKLEAGLIVLINEQTATVRLAAHRGLSAATLEEIGDIDPNSVALGDPAEQLDAPLIIEDVAVAPPLAQIAMRAEGLQSCVSIPLQAKGRLLGVINAFSQGPSPFCPADALLLSAIGDQVGVAIENAQLFAEVHRRVDELVFLNEVSQILSSTLKLEQVLTILMDQTATMLDAEAGSVSLLDEESGELVFMVAAGPKAHEIKGLKLPPGQGIAGWSAQEGQPVLVPDVSKDARWYGQVDQETGFVTRSLLCVPLISKDRVVGVVQVLNKRTGTFSEYDLSLLSSLTTVAATALENAQLYEKIRAFNEELEQRVEERTSELLTLHTIAATVSQSLDLETIVNKALEQVLALMGRQAGGFCLLDQKTDQLHLVAHRGLGEELAQEMAQFKIGQGLIGLVTSKGEPIVVEDISIAPHTLVQGIEDSDLHSVAAVPLQAAGQVVGVMIIGDFQKRPFSQEDTSLLSAIGHQIGVAVENARLYARVREEKSLTELLYDVGRCLNASLNLSEVLHNSLSLITSRLGGQRGSILFTDPDLAEYNTLTIGAIPEAVFKPEQGIVGESLAGWVVEHGEATIVFDTQRDERWLAYLGEKKPVRSAICVPLKERGRLIGVLTLVHLEPGYFNEEHRELLNSIAGQISSTVEKLRLYEQTVQARERLDTIFRNVGDALFVTDPEGTILFVNDAFQELTGYHFDEAIGQNPRLLQSSQTPPETYRDLWETILAGHVWRGELVNRRRDGTLYDADLTVAPVVDNGGNIVNFVGSQRDITPLKELGRMKDELISTVSHELRTPMASVLGFSELLLTRKLSEEKRLLYTETIHQEAGRLATLISNFLDIQRMEAGQQEYRLESLALPKVISAVQATFATQSKKHSIVVDIPEELPLVKADRDGISQVLNNLFSNAIKFSPQGGEVQVSCAAVEVNGKTVTSLTPEDYPLSPEPMGDGQWVVVSVSDEGLGIPEKALPHIFERFFRVDSSDRREIKGTGLGLAICKEIVQAHGGHIWVESEEGIGSTFRFTLPSNESQ
jgi:PAS domain S-box-containing protein